MTSEVEDAGSLEDVLGLLELLASGASTADVAAAPAPPAARDLALRVAAAREVHQRREAGLSALLETARALATENDPAQVLDAIVRRARALLGTDLAYLTLFDPEQQDTYMRATDGSVSAAFQSVRLALGAGLGGLVASTRKPYWTRRLPRRRPVPPHERDRRRRRRGGHRRDLRHAPHRRRHVRRGALRRQPHLAPVHPRGGRPPRQPRHPRRGHPRPDPGARRRRGRPAPALERARDGAAVRGRGGEGRRGPRPVRLPRPRGRWRRRPHPRPRRPPRRVGGRHRGGRGGAQRLAARR